MSVNLVRENIKSNKNILGYRSELAFVLLLLTGITVLPLLMNLGCGRKHKELPSMVTLRYVMYSEPEAIKIRRESFKLFEKKYPGIKVNLQTAPLPYMDKILTQFAAGDPPDLFELDSGFLLDFVSRDLLRTISPYIEKDKEFNLDDYFPWAYSLFSYRGEIYGIACGLCAPIMYYNKRLFDEAGLPYPDESWTWDTFRDTALKLTRRDQRGRIVQFGAYFDIPSHFIMQVLTNGGKVYNEDYTRCLLDNPPAVETLHFLHGLYQYQVTPPLGYEFDAEALFLLGKVALVPSASFWEKTVRKNKDLEWGIVLLPKGKKGRVGRLATACAVISANCKHAKEAWELMKFMASVDVQRHHIKVDPGIVPSLKVLSNLEEWLTFENPTPLQDRRLYVRAIEGSEPSPITPQCNQFIMDYIVRNEIENFLFGRNQSVEETLKKITIRINERLKDSEGKD